MLLLLSEPCKLRETLAILLREEGIPTLVATPDAGDSLLNVHDVGGVTLNGISEPHEADSLCLRLLSLYPSLPVALLLPPEYFIASHAARILRIPIPIVLLREEILAFCIEQCGCKPSPSTHALTLSPSGTALYLGYSVHLSPLEASALRLLLFRAPHAVHSHELISVCFPNGSQGLPALSDLISSINRRFSSISPETRLVESVSGFGYRLRDGIVNS